MDIHLSKIIIIKSR